MLDRNTIQKITLVFGIIYLIVGIMGFIPGITTSDTTVSDAPGAGLLLGVFGINLIHNLSHLIFGLILIWGGTGEDRAIMANRVMFVIFVVLLVAQFIGPLMNGLALNGPDLFLHLASALLTGFLGFLAYREPTGTRPTAGV